jgi:hypothetical protein
MDFHVEDLEHVGRGKNVGNPCSCKGGLTPRQQLATCCRQHFLVMTGNITKKCCRQNVANCCLGVRSP